jgi:hypothetical protein
VSFLRRSRQTATPEEGIAAFWEWWPGARVRIEAAIEAREFGAVLGEMGDRVKAIHRHMSCELTSGLKSRHAFCISASGNRAIRPLAERWLEAAPPPDQTWEYHSARQPGHRPHSEFKGLVIAERDYCIGLHLDKSTRRLDVAVFHPELARLPESKRLIGISLFLCDLLGEDDAERWIGKFESALLPPKGAVDANGLRGEIARLRELPVEGLHAIVWGVNAVGRPTSVLADLGLKRIDHLLDDQHVTVSIPLAAGWPPDNFELERLDKLEPQLEARLEGTAHWVARTTESGLREIHFVARDGAAASRVIEAWAAANPTLRVTTSTEADPEWRFRADWNGENEAEAKPVPQN